MWYSSMLACVAGVEKGREKVSLSAKREERAFALRSPTPRTLRSPNSPPSPFYACHAG